MMEIEYTQKKTNHILHGVLTVLTAGAWATVWITASVCNSGSFVSPQDYLE